MKECDYCGEEIPLIEYHIYTSNEKNTQLEEIGSFCCPECAAGQNRHFSKDPESEECGMRHRLLEKRYGHTIKPAPPPKLLYKNNKVSGMKRSQWLLQCNEVIAMLNEM